MREWTAAFEARYTELHAVLSTDAVRTIVRRILRGNNGILLSPRSGMYVVPHWKIRVLDALDEFLRAVHPDCTLRRLQLIAALENSNVIWQIRKETGQERKYDLAKDDLT